MSRTFPHQIDSESQLEDLLSEPTEGVIETMRRIDGDLLFLGIGGKMGPTLARMACRADQELGKQRRIIGISRFSNPAIQPQLQALGIETIAMDLLDLDAMDRVPKVANVVSMPAMKFGTAKDPSRTWAMCTFLPGLICQRLRDSRIVAFSSGNVYGLTPVHLMGSLETDEVRPVGEYAWSRLGGERIYEHCSRAFNIPMVQLRLNYAHELRYGVLVDIALRVAREEPVDVTMGHLNALWQGDANAMTLCAFEHADCPSTVLNLAGPETISVRRAAEEFGQLMDKPVQITGSEAADAFLSNSQKATKLYGYPRVGVQQMIQWIAGWIQNDGALLGKPTHFESRSGTY